MSKVGLRGASRAEPTLGATRASGPERTRGRTGTSSITFKNSSTGTVEAVPRAGKTALGALKTHGFGYRSVTQGLTARQVERAHNVESVRQRSDPFLVNVLLIFGVEAGAGGVKYFSIARVGHVAQTVLEVLNVRLNVVLVCGTSWKWPRYLLSVT